MLNRFQIRVTHSTDYAALVFDRWRFLLLALCTAAYFFATCYRASRKLLWFDEIFTVSLSSLPDLQSVWAALIHGADFNPPLLYVLTRISEGILGDGVIGVRFPAILGFWIFCLCLFRFVSVRTTALAGFISLLFPMVTIAYWYAYEARSYGIVLGFCGLALISWQSAAAKERGRFWSLLSLFASLTCAMLTHSYALLLFVPFTVGEAVRLAVTGRRDWAMWFTVLSPGSAQLVSLILLRSLKSKLGFFLPASLDKLFESYQSLFGPAVSILVLASVLMVISRLSWSRPAGMADPGNPALRTAESNLNGFTLHELAAALSFFLFPLCAFVLARVTGAPMLQRYCLSAVAGLAIVLGLMAANRSVIGICLMVSLLAQISIDFRSFRRSTTIEEPSTALRLSTSRQIFDSRYAWMTSDPHKDLPVLIADNLEFSPTFYYAPPELIPRLKYLWAQGPGDMNGGEYMRLIECCKAPGGVLLLRDLRANHRDFLAYGSPLRSGAISDFINDGASIVVERMDQDHFLFLVTYKPGT
jgi:hypothetical protein